MFPDSRRYLYRNRAESTLDGAITDAQTTITVADATQFPAPGIDQIVPLVMYDPPQGKYEVVYCTGVVGNVLTVERAKEDTVAYSWPDDAPIYNWVTAGLFLKLTVAPDAVYYTSRPYPYEDEASMDFSASITLARYQPTFVFTYEPIDMSPGIASAELRPVLRSYSQPWEDAIDISAGVTSSTLRAALVTYSHPWQDAMDMSAGVVSATSKTALIGYSNYSYEALDMSGGLVSGSLT